MSVHTKNSLLIIIENMQKTTTVAFIKNIINFVLAIIGSVIETLLKFFAVLICGACTTVVTAVLTPFIAIACLFNGKRFNSYFDGQYFATLFAVICDPFLVIKSIPQIFINNFSPTADHINLDFLMICIGLSLSPILIKFAASSWLAFFAIAIFFTTLIGTNLKLFSTITDLNYSAAADLLIIAIAGLVLTYIFPFATAIIVTLLLVQNFVSKTISGNSTTLAAHIVAISLATALIVAFAPVALIPQITTLAAYLGIGHLALGSLSLIFAGIAATATLGIGVAVWVINGEGKFDGSVTKYRITVITSVVIFAAATAALSVICAPVALVPLVANIALTLFSIESIGALGIISMASVFAGITTLITGLVACGITDIIVDANNPAYGSNHIPENTDKSSDSKTTLLPIANNSEFNHPSTTASSISQYGVRSNSSVSTDTGNNDKEMHTIVTM